MPYSQKSIIITENQIRPILKGILLENRESKNLHNARVYLRNNGVDDNKAKQVLDAIRHDIPNARLAQCKYLIGICRYYLHNELDIMKMNGILPFIASDAHVNEYDSDFNGIPFETLYEQFKVVKDKSSEESRKQSYGKTDLIRNQDYKIYKISSFREANKFEDYTTWCVTQSDDAYNAYTNGELGIFYFCVKNGFKNIEKPSNKSGNPLDEYGLSMIAISVDENGDLNTCTSRWNHNNYGNDHIMSKEEIEELLGVNFYETFKPRYTKEELEQINKEKDDKIIKKLEYVVNNSLFNSRNIYYNDNEGELFKKIILSDGIIKYAVQSTVYNGCFKIFNEDFTVLINQLFDYANGLKNGNGIIVNNSNNEYNILSSNGSFYFDNFKDEIDSINSLIIIKETYSSNYTIYNSNFELIIDDINGFDYDRHCDYTIIWNNDDLYNIIDNKDSLLFNKWFYDIKFITSNLVKIEVEYDKYNIYDFKKGFLLDKLVDDVQFLEQNHSFLSRNSNKIIKIIYNNKQNICDLNGNILLNHWYRNIVGARIFQGKVFAAISITERHFNLVDSNGNKLFDDSLMPIQLWFNKDTLKYINANIDKIYSLDENELLKMMSN